MAVAANDLAVLDILSSKPGLELELSEPGVRLDDSGRVMYRDWYATHQDQNWEDIHRVFIAPPTRRSKLVLQW